MNAILTKWNDGTNSFRVVEHEVYKGEDPLYTLQYQVNGKGPWYERKALTKRRAYQLADMDAS